MRRVTVLAVFVAILMVTSATLTRPAYADKAKGTFPGTLIATLDVRTSVQYYSGSFTAKKQEDRFAFAAHNGMTYYFYTTGDRKTKGAIYDSSGDILEKDNNSGEGQNFSMTWTADFTGTAYLGVIEQGKSIGAYTLAYCFALVDSAPDAPANLAASLESETSVSLSWPDVLGEDGYIIYRDGEEIDRVGDDVASYADSFSFTAGSWYAYSVSAYNSVGESEAVAADAVLPHVDAPVDVEVTLNSQTSVTIAWSDVEGASGYVLYRDGTEIARTADNSHTDDFSFAAGTSYTYSVSAYNEVGESEAVAADAVIPLVAAPSALTATVLSTTSVLLEWPDVEGESGYVVYMDGAIVGVVGADVVSYTYSYSYALGTTYVFGVSSYNAVGESATTNSAGVIPNPLPPTVCFTATYGASRDDVIYSTIPLADGGFIAFGFCNGPNHDALVMRTDGSGNLLWSKRLDYGGNDTFFKARMLADGNFAAVGFALDPPQGGNNAKILAAEFDVNGNVVWQQVMGGSGDNYATDVIEASDGSLMITAQTLASGAGGIDGVVIKMSRSGSVLWCKTYGGSSWDTFTRIVETNDGFILLGATEGSYSSVDWDAWALQIDFSGNLIWQSKLDGSHPDFFNDMAPTDDGNFILVGTTSNLFGGSNNEMLIAKMTPSGTFLWQKVISSSGSEGAYRITRLSDGNFLIGGCTNSYGNGGFDMILLKIDANCNIIWQRTYGRTGDDYLMQVKELPDGKLVFSGDSTGSSADVFIAVADGNGLFDGTRPSFCKDSAYTVQSISYPVYQTSCIAKPWAIPLLSYTATPVSVSLTVTFLY
ncbi:MAG: hypothetical protein WC712_07645 [Candidatus Brocadiia bacterium]